MAPLGTGVSHCSQITFFIRIPHGATTATTWHRPRSSCMATATAATTFRHCTFSLNLFLCNPNHLRGSVKKHVSFTGSWVPGLDLLTRGASWLMSSSAFCVISICHRYRPWGSSDTAPKMALVVVSACWLGVSYYTHLTKAGERGILSRNST